ncbi:MAG TPA: GNA1162 family protein [Nitrospirota bacterium]|nr:GNA1162 family protein [Nitrospirota bacterium]
MPRAASRFYIVFFVFIVLAGCVPPRPIPRYRDVSNPLKRVAVLPMKNDTLDVDGPNVVRKKMIAALENKSYYVKNTQETDQILRDQMGINLGGQLELTTPQKIGEVLGVEGLLYGTLMDFDETTTGLLDVKKVRAKFKLVNAMTGQTVWERGLGVRSEVRMSGTSGSAVALAARAADAKEKDVPWVTIESAATNEKNVGRSLAYSVGAQLFSKAVGIHLDYESSELVRRVADNLPWGPGPVDVATLPPPVITVPEIKMPEPPSFGYMDWEGKRDFSAVIFSTSFDKSRNEPINMETPIAIAGNRIRMDMDMSGMMKGASQSPLSKVVMIGRGDKNISYTLYPNSQKYMVHKENAEIREKPQIERTIVGSEVVNKHPTDKFKVRITYKDGRVEEGFIWNARDLDGMTIKSEVENKDFKITTELRHIVLRTPRASLFEIPDGYAEAKSIMDLMSSEPNKK